MIVFGTVMLWVYVESGETIVWASKHGPEVRAVGWWGLPTASFIIGAVAASAAMLADHYDERPNEHFYARVMSVGVALMVLGKISMIIVFHQLRHG